MITKNNLENMLVAMNFIKSTDRLYSKDFGNNIILNVDIKDGKIIYPDGITVNDETTCNFRANENFVVLECVNRLLDKGYQPHDIELEPRWQVGHGASGGKADILLKDRRNNPLLIIECKTAGAEFEKEWKNMEEDGGQLFSYLQQDSNVKYLCLYCSDFIENSVQNEYKLISVQDNTTYLQANDRALYETAKNIKERYNVWKETYGKDYATRGIFEPDVSLYEIGKFKYTLDDLEKVDTSGKIQKLYGKYRQILRKYNVSSEENAFDKLVNLFLCKIVDETNNEDKSIDEQLLKFYWKGSAFDDRYDLQDRLQGLYKQGMKDFLGEEITYIEDEKVQETFRRFKQDPDAIKDQIIDYFHQLKFYTNGAFSFIDVHNKKLFEQNSEILLDTIKMFQDLELKSDKNNQFLGDLFEGFLNQGIKQSEGQFFTPLPIVRFIVSSLPLEYMISETRSPLKTIDYACGSGHFLTEYTEQITDILKKENKEENLTDYYKSTYGIEKESRLAKVSKVSAFMFGKGGIKIIYSDGLHQTDEIKNETFDLIIANPPYSVKGFLETLSDTDKKSYELYKYISDISKSDVIQLFFIERAKQLLKDGGIAAIIVPSTTITKDGVYSESTKLILKYFDIISVIQLAKGVFSQTGTETVILFLRKKPSIAPLHAHYKNRVNIWFSNNFDKTNATEEYYQDLELAEKYCTHIKTDFETYKNTVCNMNNRQKNLEKEKLYYYLLAQSNPQSVLVLEMPNETDDIQQFIGYKWSKRKGCEGIQYLNSKNNTDEDSLSVNDIKKLETPLFNPNNLSDETRLNSLIRNQILNNDFEIPDVLENNIRLLDLQNMISFKSTKKNKWHPELSLTGVFDIDIPSKYGKQKLDDIISINPKSKIQVNACKNDYTKQYPFYTSGENIYTSNEHLVNGENIFISTGGRACVKYYNGDACYSTDTLSIKSSDESQVLTKYIYTVLEAYTKEIQDCYFKGVTIEHLQKPAFLSQEIPVPSIKKQEKILNLLTTLDNEKKSLNKKIQTKEESIVSILKDTNNTTKYTIGEIGDIKMCKRILQSQTSYNGDVPFYKIGTLGEQANAYISHQLFEEYKNKYQYPNRGEVLISAAGTIGKTWIFDGKPAYFQDSNIVWVSNDEHIILNEYLARLYKITHINTSTGGSVNRAYNDLLRSTELNIPPLEIQKQKLIELVKLEKEIKESKDKIAQIDSQKRVILLEELSN